MELPAQTFTYKRVGDLEIQLDVHPVESTMPTPVIVWIHGGALMVGTRKWGNGVQRQLLREAGYTQISIDYRLAPETKLPEIVGDVRDAFHWIEKEAGTLKIDASRLGVIGHSAGGYLSLMTGCCLGLKPRAIVSFYGYGDLIGDWYAKPDPFYLQQPPVSEAEARATVGETPLADAGKSDRGKFYLYCRQQGLWPEMVLGVDPHANPEAFTPYCPAQNVTAGFPPTLLLHGTDDTDVPYAQSAIMAEAFKKSDVAHELITIQGGGHGFDGKVKAEHLTSGETTPELAALYKALQWFGKYV